MITRREFLRLSLMTGAVVLTGCRGGAVREPPVQSAPEAPAAASMSARPAEALLGTALTFDKQLYWEGDERIAEWLAKAQTAPNPDFTPTIKVPRLVEVANEVETDVSVPLVGSAERYVRRLILYDPESLVKVKFVANFSPKVPVADVSTLIKMLTSSQLAAIAETNAGERWWGQSDPIQVGVGGCAVGQEPVREVPNDVLRVRFRDAGKWVRAEVRLHHPMVSGLSIDEAGNVTKVYEPFYADRLTVTYAGETIVEFELTAGLSENTRVSFAMPRLGNDPLTVTVTNNEGGEFSLNVLISV
jgi:hypothetical protein